METSTPAPPAVDSWCLNVAVRGTAGPKGWRRGGRGEGGRGGEERGGGREEEGRQEDSEEGIGKKEDGRRGERGEWKREGGSREQERGCECFKCYKPVLSKCNMVNLYATHPGI